MHNLILMLQAFHRILGALYKSQKKQESAQVDIEETSIANNCDTKANVQTYRWRLRSTSCTSVKCRRRQSATRMTGRTSYGWSALTIVSFSHHIVIPPYTQLPVSSYFIQSYAQLPVSSYCHTILILFRSYALGLPAPRLATMMSG